MSKDRDRRRIHTPHEGVKAQIAPPEGEAPQTWEHQLTPVHLTPVDQPTIDESDEQSNERRYKETKNAAAVAANASTTTLYGLRELRKEYREDVRELRDDIRHTNKRLDVVVAIANESVGQNKVILEYLEEQRTAKVQSGEIRVVRETVTAEIHGARAKSEIGIAEAEAKAEIEVKKARRTAWIDSVKQIGVKGALYIGGAVATAIAAGVGIGQCGD